MVSVLCGRRCRIISNLHIQPQPTPLIIQEFRYENKSYILIPTLIICIAAALCVWAQGEEGEYISYPHSTSSFTEGLFFYDGMLYESTGLYGSSEVYRAIDLETGKPGVELKLEDELFGEGSVVFDGKLYVLTYKENKALILEPDTLELLDTVDYPRDGWGLTTDGEYLIAGDGSAQLFYMDSELNLVRTLDVTLDGEPINNINELEYIDGQIWANIWKQSYVVIIDPVTGEVTETIDFGEILPAELFEDKVHDVLNGIAYNPQEDRVYVTGKDWLKLYCFERSRIIKNS